jgi:hypothetical protein
MPSLAGATRGLTMMGKAVSAATLDLAALPTGTMFDGRYTIVDLLGLGGMGAVYQALPRCSTRSPARRRWRSSLTTRTSWASVTSRPAATRPTW